MTFKPQNISNFLNSRGGMATAWVLALICSLAAMHNGHISHLEGDGGLAFPSANNWLPAGWADWGLAFAANAGIALLAVAINRTYNVLRNLTMLFGGLYAVFSMATPSIFGQFYGGTLLCLVMLLCQFLLYGIYGAPSNTRTTFLIFFLMALTALVVRAAIYMFPILILGCLQMRILNLRNAIALLIGIVTPVWILVGMGILQIDSFAWPHISYDISAWFSGTALPMMVTFIITMVLGLLATLANLYRTLSYNTRTRSYNGFIAVTMILTSLLMIIDFSDILVFVPLLNIVAAIQLAHFFIWQNEKISYIPIVVIIATYIGLYFWNV